MKRSLFLLAVVSTALLLNACGGSSNDDQLKKDIVGEYGYTQTESQKGVNLTINAVAKFGEDATTSMTGTMNLVMEMKELAMLGVTEPIVMAYDFSMRGKYDIKNSHLIYDYDTESISISLTESDDSEFSEMLGGIIKPLLESINSNLQKEIVNNTKEKIVELDEEHMVLERGGVQTIYKRLK